MFFKMFLTGIMVNLFEHESACMCIMLYCPNGCFLLEGNITQPAITILQEMSSHGNWPFPPPIPHTKKKKKKWILSWDFFFKGFVTFDLSKSPWEEKQSRLPLGYISNYSDERFFFFFFFKISTLRGVHF